MKDYAIIKSTTLQGFANAIREKYNTDEEIPVSSMYDMIQGIDASVDNSVSTLTDGSQMLEGIIACDANGNAITGTIPTKSQNDLEVVGAQVKVPAGYYAELAKKSIQEVELGKPVISVNSSGLVNSSVTHTASGYVVAGTKAADPIQLDTQAGYEVEATTSSKTAVAKGKYTTGDVKVKALTDYGAVYPGDSSATYTGKVTVNAVRSQTKSITPEASGKWYYPDSGYYFNAVYVDGANSSPIVATGTKIEYDLFHSLTFTLDNTLSDWNAMFLSSSNSGTSNSYYTIVHTTIIKVSDGSYAYSYVGYNYGNGTYTSYDISKSYGGTGEITATLSGNKFTVAFDNFYFAPSCTYTIYVVGH